MLHGLRGKTTKVITVALCSLQRLVSLRALSLFAVLAIVQTVNDSMSQGVDIQLKILQSLLSLITNFPAVHGRLLVNVRTSISLSYCTPSILLDLGLMGDEC